ncbi:Uncharacterised protein [Bordetella pertussis]|nr:Uncharacterised protein [Bordetella pertussis]CFP65416.1 Uncharacterised protein [Bordetella pertussis]
MGRPTSHASAPETAAPSTTDSAEGSPRCTGASAQA